MAMISEQGGTGGNGTAAKPERDEKARRAALEFATSTIRKKHGPGAIMRLGSDWRPQVETAEGLKDTARWYREMGWL